MELNELLKAERIRAGITQKELAEKASIPQPNIVRFEREGGTIKTAERIAKALGCELSIKGNNHC